MRTYEYCIKDNEGELHTVRLLVPKAIAGVVNVFVPTTFQIMHTRDATPNAVRQKEARGRPDADGICKDCDCKIDECECI